MILVGELSLWVALLMAVWAATVSFAGGSMGRRDLVASGERAIYATLAMAVLASAGLWTAIFAHDFSIKYVASFTSANLPRAYLITAFWTGQAGSLLFWCLILSIYSALALWTNRTHNRSLMPYVTGTLAIVLVFVLAAMCLGANPYERLDWIPPEGQGMNPQLQSLGAAIHLPILYIGYAATAIPFAFAIAALLTRRPDAEWLGAVQRWALVAWFFNTTAILLGMWRAYVEPEWGGYWVWEPLRNASLLLWLVNAAVLLSILVQEKQGKLGKWNVTFVPSHRRRYGGYIAFTGTVLIFLAFSGLAFKKQYDLVFKAGDAREIVDPLGHRWRFVSQGISTYDVLNRQVTAVLLDVSRDGEPAGVITSEKRQYVDSRGAPTSGPSTEPGIRSSFREDVYVVLARVRGDDTTEIRVKFNPLVRWVWLGGALIAIGGLTAMWPPTEIAGP